MCEKNSREKRSEIVWGKERASERGWGGQGLESGVVNAHGILGWKCLLETHLHNDCTPVKCLLKFMVNLGLADLVLEKENSFLENAEYAL